MSSSKDNDDRSLVEQESVPKSIVNFSDVTQEEPFKKTNRSSSIFKASNDVEEDTVAAGTGG